MAQEIHVVLGPTINLHRSVLGGRLFEAYSEDPLLTGKLAAAYVRGLQAVGRRRLPEAPGGQRVRDRPQHGEQRRRRGHAAGALPAAVRDRGRRGGPWSIMAAYNDVNGQAATEHEHVNNEIVKGEWGYRRADHVRLVRHQDRRAVGQRRARPGDARARRPVGSTALIAAVEAGEVAEAVIDDHVRPAAAARRPGRCARHARGLSRPTCRRPTAPSAREQLTPAGGLRHDRADQQRDVLPLAATADGRADRPARASRPPTWVAVRPRSTRRTRSVWPRASTALLGDGGHRRRRRRGADPAGRRPDRNSSPIRRPASRACMSRCSTPTAPCSRSAPARPPRAMVGFDDDFAAAGPACAVRGRTHHWRSGRARRQRSRAAGR